VIHRESGVLKTTYEADMALYPLPIARWTVAAIAVLMFLILPLILHEYYLSIINLVSIAVVGALALRAAAGAMVGLGVGGARGALLLVDQRLPVGDGDLVVVGMDLAEGEEAVAVAAVVDEGSLKRRLDARDLGEIDVTAKLLAVG